jgi:hypothetical protein
VRNFKLQAPNLFVACLILANALVACASEVSPGPAAWSRSIVTIEVNRKQYDYYQPWTKRTRRVQKAGTVIGDKQILTTADEMYERTLVRLQKGGRGRWWIGEVSWIDYPANLALVTVADEDFWKDLRPATFAKPGLPDGPLQIVRWREGKLENRAAEFTQATVRESQLSPVDLLALEASSEIQAAGWGEPLVVNSHLTGIVYAQDGRTCIAAPVSFIETILKARKKGAYHGLSYFHFFWQPTENPATPARLKLSGSPRGVMVTEVPSRPDNETNVLKRFDILLNVDGFDLDTQGDYIDPNFGPVMLENLATRGKSAGDDVKMQIWRDGKPMNVTYRLPRFAYTNSLVPYATYDEEPKYLILGGLVFQPLTDSYLQAWGSDWKRRAPFRLYYYNNENPTKDRTALVILSQVLPDSYNIGYQDQRSLVLDKVNGQPVHRLSELNEALKKPSGDFHVFEFTRGDSLQRMVLAAGDAADSATSRVLKRYGIAEPSRW